MRTRRDPRWDNASSFRYITSDRRMEINRKREVVRYMSIFPESAVQVFCVQMLDRRNAPRIFPLFSGFYDGSQLLSLGEALEAVAENVTGGLESSKTVNRRCHEGCSSVWRRKRGAIITRTKTLDFQPLRHETHY